MARQPLALRNVNQRVRIAISGDSTLFRPNANFRSDMTATSVDTAPISITSTALAQLEAIRNSQRIPELYGLRVGVKGGGCSGFSYILGFDKRKADDQIFQLGDLTILMNRGHGLYLLGMEIDWVEGLDNRGFSFNNPNAKDTCGCGTSFNA